VKVLLRGHPLSRRQLTAADAITQHARKLSVRCAFAVRDDHGATVRRVVWASGSVCV
jgi:hypothetical protein